MVGGFGLRPPSPPRGASLRAASAAPPLQPEF